MASASSPARTAIIARRSHSARLRLPPPRLAWPSRFSSAIATATCFFASMSWFGHVDHGLVQHLDQGLRPCLIRSFRLAFDEGCESREDSHGLAPRSVDGKRVQRLGGERSVSLLVWALSLGRSSRRRSRSRDRAGPRCALARAISMSLEHGGDFVFMSTFSRGMPALSTSSVFLRCA